MKTEIHFDSIYSINNNNPFDTVFTLTSSMSNVRTIKLKSMEIPIAFQNIRNGLNTFTLNMGSTNYSITIPPNNYSSIATLCTDITTLFNSSSIPNNPTFTSTGNKILITVTGNVNFNVVQSNLSRYILGFNGNQISSYSSTNSTITSQFNYLLNVDNYINMYLADIPYSNNTSNGLIASFKIPLNAVNNVVYFFGEENSFSQSLDITNPTFVISQIKVKLIDRFGNVLDNNGVDYSFSLEFFSVLN